MDCRRRRSNVAPYRLSRSCIRKRGGHRSQAQHSTNCWAVHSAVGYGVTGMCRISRLTCLTTKRRTEFGTRLFERKRSHRPIYWTRAVSGTCAIPRWPSIEAAAHVLGDGPGRNLKSQSCEFGLDSFLTPEPVFDSHLSDESLKVLGNRPSTNPPTLAI